MRSLYATVITRLLVESRADTFAREIVKDVVEACKVRASAVNEKRSLKMKLVKPWPEALARQGSNDSEFMTIILSIRLGTGPRDAASVTGSWLEERSTMTLDVTVISPTGTLLPQHLSSIQLRAYDTVRHELEHAMQSDEATAAATEAYRQLQAVPGGIWSDPEVIEAYFLSPAEVEAFVAGIYHAAKRERVPFVQQADQLINRFVKLARSKGGSGPDVLHVLDKVRGRWLDYARTRFPKAIVRY